MLQQADTAARHTVRINAMIGFKPKMSGVMYQIALWKGGLAELEMLQKNLDGALTNQLRLVMWKWLLSAATYALDYAGAVLNFVCVALPIAAGKGSVLSLVRLLRLGFEELVINGLQALTRPGTPEIIANHFSMSVWQLVWLFDSGTYSAKNLI